MKKRKKHVLSKSGVMYKIVLDDEQEQIQINWLSSNNLRINKKKRELQYSLNLMGLDMDMVSDDKKSVTYRFPKHLQKRLLRMIKKS